MGANPRIVTEEVVFLWDGVTQRLPRGQVMDVTPGSALEAAIGVQRLRPLGAVAPQSPAPAPEPEKPAEAPAKQEAAPQEKPEPAPAKAKAAAKAPEKDGGS